MSSVLAVPAAQAGDVPAILDIVNEAILHSTALFEYEPRTLREQLDWLAQRRAGGWPVLVADAGDGAIGYASYGPFRPQDGYRETVEHSVYIRSDLRGGGRGRGLMAQLIGYARAQGQHVMVAAVDASNTASIALHRSLGFEDVGMMPQVGQKFGRWLDLALLQLVLDARTAP